MRLTSTTREGQRTRVCVRAWSNAHARDGHIEAHDGIRHCTLLLVLGAGGERKRVCDARCDPRSCTHTCPRTCAFESHSFIHPTCASRACCCARLSKMVLCMHIQLLICMLNFVLSCVASNSKCRCLCARCTAEVCTRTCCWRSKPRRRAYCRSSHAVNVSGLYSAHCVYADDDGRRRHAAAPAAVMQRFCAAATAATAAAASALITRFATSRSHRLLLLAVCDHRCCHHCCCHHRHLHLPR